MFGLFGDVTVRKQLTHEFPRGLLAAMLLFSAAAPAQNAEPQLKPVQHEFVIRNFKTESGNEGVHTAITGHGDWIPVPTVIGGNKRPAGPFCCTVRSWSSSDIHPRSLVTKQSLSQRLKISLDELRMQVLGTQVLFGFQFQSLFQPGFDRATPAERIADAGSLTMILISFAALLLPPCQHRLFEAGDASRRLIVLSNHCAELALATMALALGLIGYSIGTHAGARNAFVIAGATATVSLLTWFGLGLLIARPTRAQLPEREMVDLHAKIDQMLTEARVILPGAQAMLGFQLIVVMTQAFERLERGYQILHYVGLALTTLSVIFLIAPAAVHRLAFGGEDTDRFYRVGAALVTAALIPLSFAFAAESCVAAWKLTQSMWASMWCGAGTLALLLGFWYGMPLGLRLQQRT
jgi:hypothetical protein